MANIQDDLSDIRCVFCGSCDLFRRGDIASDDGIRLRVVVCERCGAGADVVDGVPFFGEYDRDDFLGLVEIIATAKMNQAGLSVDSVRFLHRLLEEYHRSEDKARLVRDHPSDMLRASWWPYRYHEWLQNSCVIADRDLSGKTLLNVGAGIGHDSVQFVDAGAVVTCIDYSPMLTGVGRRSLPQARWIGGFSHALPFRDESFDVVCANAALHHMRSVPAALLEMLRVLKPGGFLFTTGDPLRPDASDEQHEFAVFDRHLGVLGGINERIVPFGAIYDTFGKFGEKLDVAMVADVAAGERLKGTRLVAQGQFNDAWVPLDPSNIEQMRKEHGSGAFLVDKKDRLQIAPGLQSQTVLSAGTIASWVHDESRAFAKLMPYAPLDLVDRAFPGTSQAWSELQNGWTMPLDPYASRLAFNRARWLLNIPAGSQALSFDVRSISPEIRAFQILLNGSPAMVVDVGPTWRGLSVPVDSVEGRGAVLIEMRWAGDTPASSFDEKAFEVKDRALA